MEMYENHPFTLHKICPCKIEEDVIKQTKEIHKNFPNTALFVQELERQRVKGKKIWFDEEDQTIYISKRPASEWGIAHPQNDSLIGKACHCIHYNHSKEFHPKEFCQCAAEYYRPMFEPIFGKKIELFPFKTVLSGDEECVIAVKLIGE